MLAYLRLLAVLLSGMLSAHAFAADADTLAAMKRSSPAQIKAMDHFMRAVGNISGESDRADDAFMKKRKPKRPLVVENMTMEVIKVRDINKKALAEVKAMKVPTGLGPMANTAARWRAITIKSLELREQQYAAAWDHIAAKNGDTTYMLEFYRLGELVGQEMAKLGSIAWAVSPGWD